MMNAALTRGQEVHEAINDYLVALGTPDLSDDYRRALVAELETKTGGLPLPSPAWPVPPDFSLWDTSGDAL